MNKFYSSVVCDTEIKHTDWLKEYTWLGKANQRAYFQNRIAMLLLNLFMTLAPENTHTVGEYHCAIGFQFDGLD